MKRFFICIICVLLSVSSLFAHPKFITHCEDIMDVLGFEYNLKLFKRSKDTKNNKSWTKIISSDMIDNKEFHRTLEKNHEGFKISSGYTHRYLFHWPYDTTEPWNKEIEQKVREYCENYDLNVETNLRIFKSEIASEQKKRKRFIEKETQRVFGFAAGGIEGNLYTHFFISMAYFIHILGDYMSGDNTRLEGLYPLELLTIKICEELKAVDAIKARQIIKGINRVSHEHADIQERADFVMLYLKQTVPNFVRTARNGNMKMKLEGRGFKLRKT